MDVTRLVDLVARGVTPLVRTNFHAEERWLRVAAEATAATNDGAPVEPDEDDSGYVPNIAPVSDMTYDGATPESLAGAWPTERTSGYAVLADARGMADRAGTTVVWGDLTHEPGRSFRCPVGDVATVEANLSIANMDFAEFAEHYASNTRVEPRPPAPETSSGLAASRRIGCDVDQGPGARALSGRTAALEVHRRVPGTRRKLFSWFAHWLSRSLDGGSWMFSGSIRNYELGVPEYGMAGDSHPDRLTGRRGAVRSILLTVQPPRRVVRQWDWLVAPAGRPYVSFPEWVPFLQQSTVVTTTLHTSKDGEGRPWTDVDVRHERLPEEWVDDMTAWWSYQLALADRLVP